MAGLKKLFVGVQIVCWYEAAEASSLNHDDKPRTLTTELVACKLTKQLRFNNAQFEYFFYLTISC